jgi:hypothetical protein
LNAKSRITHLTLATLLIILTIYFPLSNVPSSEASSLPSLEIQPPHTMAELDDVFSVNATVNNVTDLGGWEFKLYFLKSLINFATTAEGPFLKQGGSTVFFIVESTNSHNATHGRVWLTCSLLGGVPGVNGSGTLATINFQAVGFGTTPLHFADSVLGDSTATPIQHTPVDGAAEISSPVMITNITPFAAIVAQGFMFPINVTTLNESGVPATFNLSTYYNTTEIQTQQITQPSGTSINTTFTWNTTTVPRYHNYTISAGSLTDTFVDGTITMVMAGDVDADRDVDIFDIVAIAGAYGCEPGDPLYAPKFDINCDNKIDIFDIVIAAGNYGYQEP